MDIDKQLYNFFERHYGGFFLETGANDGINQSNTYLLEKNNNWRGLLIEPSNVHRENLIKNRSNSIIEICAVSDKNEKLFGDFDGRLMSSVNGTRLNRNNLHEVNCYTITELCKKHNISKIDLFSLDTEGHEYSILKGINFDDIDIKHFVIEIYDYDQDLILDFMQKKSYKYTCLTNYSKNTHPMWDGTHQDYFFTKI